MRRHTIPPRGVESFLLARWVEVLPPLVLQVLCFSGLLLHGLLSMLFVS